MKSYNIIEDAIESGDSSEIKYLEKELGSLFELTVKMENELGQLRN